MAVSDKDSPARIVVGAHTPRAAFDAFVKRGALQPTFNWWDVWQEEHQTAFMVSGVAQADVLRDIQEQVADAIKNGRHFEDFYRTLQPKLAAKGWWGDVAITDPLTGEQRITRFDKARLELILDTNLRVSHAAGRWHEAQRAKRRRPYLMYTTMRDARVREVHRPWDGVVLHIDHPWWDTHYPPNGWRCRCRAISLSERDIERYRRDGFPIKTQPPHVEMRMYKDKRTGQTLPVPAGIDPGWAYNAGKARASESNKLARQPAMPPPDDPVLPGTRRPSAPGVPPSTPDLPAVDAARPEQADVRALVDAVRALLRKAPVAGVVADAKKIEDALRRPMPATITVEGTEYTVVGDVVIVDGERRPLTPELRTMLLVQHAYQVSIGMAE